MIGLADVRAAHERLQGVVYRTPLVRSATFSQMAGMEVLLKLDNLQKTGSFKVRGAFNKIVQLDGEARRRGVLAASAGNHAQGVALAARMCGLPCTVVMPEGAPITKVVATRGYGAEVVQHGGGYDEAYGRAMELQAERGATFVHAFDDPAVIAGQGTVGLEIAGELPEVDTVVAPVGGGGLLAGMALALKELRPQVRVVGVQAAAVPAMYASFREGQWREVPGKATIADGIAVKRPGQLTLPLLLRYVDDMVLVEEQEIAGAILLLLERAKLVVEGAGAAALAALLSGRLGRAGRTVAVVLSGGNIDVTTLSRIIERGLVETGRYVRFRTLLLDKPGQLTRLLKIVADAGGNIIYVNHDRWGTQAPLGEVQVELALEARDGHHVAEILDSLARGGYEVQR